MIKKILLEPLTHFILIALGFFIAYDLLTPSQTSLNSVTISSGRVEQLKNRFEKVWQRAPTEEELNELIENYALDEIYTLEARALGLDINDGVVRKRLRKKMEFMLQDMAALNPPSDQELQDFYQQHADKYKTGNNYTFSQIFISVDRHQAELERIITEQQHRISTQQAPQGESILLPSRIKSSTDAQVISLFGEVFISALKKAPLNEWHGPARSGLGVHFIKVEHRTPSKLPALEAVRDKVSTDWRYFKNKEFKKQFEENLLQQYQVTVQPENLASN